MILQILAIATLAVSAQAGLSYSSGGIGLGGGLEGGLGLGGGIGIGHAAPVHVAQQSVVDYYTPAHYEFNYGVEDPHTGDRKQQSESRVGDTVKGQYSLAEPDGTIRVVKYTADPHNGFNAVVSRIGHASHPQIVASHGIALSHGGLSHGGIGLGGGLGFGGGLGHGGGLGLGGYGGH